MLKGGGKEDRQKRIFLGLFSGCMGVKNDGHSIPGRTNYAGPEENS
jgi:hypothetical protein